MAEEDVEPRSAVPIQQPDLEHMRRLALDHFDDFFRHHPRWQPYAARLLAIALCQGGAMHYLDRRTGLKDIDLWAFFAEVPAQPFPARVGWSRDYGRSKFGRHPNFPALAGRPVDLFGRSLKCGPADDPLLAITKWLQGGGRSASELTKKAIVLIHPPGRCGEVVWPLTQ